MYVLFYKLYLQRTFQYKNLFKCTGLLNDNFYLSIVNVFRQVCYRKQKWRLGFVSERWIWLFCIAIIIAANAV